MDKKKSYQCHFQNFVRASSYGVDDVNDGWQQINVDADELDAIDAMILKTLDVANSIRTTVSMVHCLFYFLTMISQNLVHVHAIHNNMDRLKIEKERKKENR